MVKFSFCVLMLFNSELCVILLNTNKDDETVVMATHLVDGSKSGTSRKSISFVVRSSVEVSTKHFDWGVMSDSVCSLCDVDVACCVVDAIVRDSVVGGGERSSVDLETIFVASFDYKHEITSVSLRRVRVLGRGEGVVSRKLFDRWKHHHGRIRRFCAGLLTEN